MWGEDNVDLTLSFTLSFAATSSRSGEEHRDLLPIRGGQDKVILDKAKARVISKGDKLKVISEGAKQGDL